MTLSNEIRASVPKGIDTFSRWDLPLPANGSIPPVRFYSDRLFRKLKCFYEYTHRRSSIRIRRTILNVQEAAGAIGPGGLPESEWVIETIELKRGPQGMSTVDAFYEYPMIFCNAVGVQVPKIKASLIFVVLV